MKYFFYIIIFLTFVTNSYSQYVWQNQYSGVSDNLNSIIFTDSYTGYACGNLPYILKTTDKGNTWMSLFTSNYVNHYSIISIQNKIIAVGDNGRIVTSTNQGNSWQTTYHSVTQSFRDISYDGSQAFIVGDYGTFLRSTNGGLNWISIVTPVQNQLNSKSGEYIVGDNGLILKWGPAGEWTQIPSNTTERLLSITKDPSGGYYVCGNSGTLLKVKDNSVTTLNSGVTEHLKDIFVIRAGPVNIKYCVGNAGTLIRSVYSDSDWERFQMPLTTDINSIYMTDKSTGYTAGNFGKILTTYNRVHYPLKMDGNNISTWFQQTGSFNSQSINHWSGFEWPKNSNKFARYISGLFLGAVINGDTLVTCSEYYAEYLPGYTNDNHRPEGKDDPAYRIYKLTSGVNDLDRAKWPNSFLQNSDQGAPVYLNYLTGFYEPMDYGNQTMFLRMTDSYPESHFYICGNTKPLYADVKLINYSFDSREDLKNILYSHFQIINRGQNIWNNAFVTFYTDDDGNFDGGKIGCDTNLNLGYSYAARENVPVYGDYPPAVGFKIIRGANYYTGDYDDTLSLYSGKNRYLKRGFKTKGMTSFNHFWDDGPSNFRESYQCMNGLMFRNNGPIITPQGDTTKFFYSGDPETGTGWYMDQSFGTYRRTFTTTGPVNVNPGDTQHIIVAQVIAQGSNYLNSVTKLKEASAIAQQYYDNLFENVPVGIQNENDIIPNEYSLDQNYPNPFNSSTVIKFSIPKKDHVNLKIYDILGREVFKLVDSELDAGNYRYNFQSSSVNNASGIFFIVMKTEDFKQSRKMLLLK